ncbi:MAG: 30S ribosomal protein S9 [Planctomycetota bacterium]|jgi:small subunit ribosomal protein S9|nr:30S ribosomal protein S9 [Planctomycetota bacterium]
MTDESTATTTAAADTSTASDFAWGTGRRKSSVARVRIRPGKGLVTVNGRPLDDYFPVLQQRVHILAPLHATSAVSRYDVFVNVSGGGSTGQAGALRLGISRALVKAEPELSEALREGSYLTRDGRMVERKKYGQRKARRRYQFSKR